MTSPERGSMGSNPIYKDGFAMTKLVTAGLALVGIATAAYGADQNSEMAVLQESKPLVTRAGAWHTWNDHIHLKPG